MILPGNATLIISAVRHLLKLGSRIDHLAAERTAVQSDLVLQLPPVATPDTHACVDLVRDELERTAGRRPDPFGTDRAVLSAEVALSQPSAAFGPIFKKYFPDTALLANPDGAYLAKLQAAFPGLDWTDPGARIAAFAVAAGSDNRDIGYNARIALAVADTLLEFGTENTALFVRDEKLRGIAQSVLQRLAEPDWDSFQDWNPLLQAALKSVLNAAVDVAEQNPAGNPWLEGVLDALVQARKDAPQPDDYLLGLVHGDGFRVLLAKGLLVASDQLDVDQADPFRLVAADVLSAAAPLVQDPANPDFRQFFNDHWGDLLRAGLSSVDRHGDLILGGTKPPLRSVLQVLVQQLAQIPAARFLTSETVYRLTDAVIGVVAGNLGNQPGLENQPWLRDVLTAVVASAQQLTAKNLFTREAAEALVLDAVGALAQHPQLLLAQPGLPQALVAAVLGSVAQLQRPDARAIGGAALHAALNVIAADPSLASASFGPVVSATITRLAGFVDQGKFTADQAAAIASAAIEAVARNPRIYAGAQRGIAAAVVSAVQQAFPADATWSGRLLVETAREALLAVARDGAPVANQGVAPIQRLLATVLSAGLAAAAARLGTNLDLDGIPPVLGGLVSLALRGDLTVFDPASPQFLSAFQALAAQP